MLRLNAGSLYKHICPGGVTANDNPHHVPLGIPRRSSPYKLNLMPRLGSLPFNQDFPEIRLS